MKFIVTIILFLFVIVVDAQDSCNCVTIFKSINYPKKAEQNKISGTVIIEWKVSADGIWSNPVILKSLGYGCDEEALKAIKSMMITNNSCRLKCKIKSGKEGKLSQTFNFTYTDQ